MSSGAVNHPSPVACAHICQGDALSGVLFNPSHVCFFPGTAFVSLLELLPMEGWYSRRLLTEILGNSLMVKEEVMGTLH